MAQKVIDTIITSITKMVGETIPYALAGVSNHKFVAKGRKGEVFIQLPILPTAKDEPAATATKSQTAQILEGLDQLDYETVTISQGTFRMIGIEILPEQNIDPDKDGATFEKEIQAMAGIRKAEANAKFWSLFTGLAAADINANPAAPDKNKVLEIALAKGEAADFDKVDAAIGVGQEYLANYSDNNVTFPEMSDVVGYVGMTTNRVLTKKRYLTEESSALFAALMKPVKDVNGNYFWLVTDLNRKTFNGKKIVAIMHHKDALAIQDPLAKGVSFDQDVAGNRVLGKRWNDVMAIAKKGLIVVITEAQA